MFKNCFALTKILLKSVFDSGAISLKTNKKSSKKTSKNSSLIVASIILVLFLGVPMFLSGFAIGSIIKSYDPSAMIIMMDNILPIMMLAIFLLSMISIISVFFFSMDNISLLPLPLKSWEILIARFISSLGYVYLMELLFVAPIMIGLSIGFDLSIVQFVIALLVLIALPFFPISICAIVFTYLSRIINFSKYKNAFTYISVFLAIGISLTISLGSSSITGEFNPEDISKIVDLIKTMDSLFIKIFPFLIPAAKALTTSNVLVKLLWILLFLVINSLFVALFAIVCQKPYYKTLKESDNHGGKKKKFSKEELSSYSSSSSTFKSLVVTEWRTIVRSPAFFSNTIMAVLLVPIIMVVAFAVAFEVEGGSQGFGFSALIQDLQNQSLGNSIALLAILAILLFLCSMNMTSSSAVSRMGKSASFIKTIPVKASTIVYSKLFIGTILSCFVSLAFIILLIVLGIINIFDGLLLFILVCSLNLLDNHFGFYFDLRKPVLNWDNENLAVKNNLNTLWGLLLSFVVIAIIVVLCIIFIAVTNGGYIAYAISLALSILGNVLFHLHYKKPAKLLFKAI